MKNKINLKKEMSKLKEHRKQYFPVMHYLQGLYNKRDSLQFPVAITDTEKMLITLELIDIEYLNKKAFDIRKDRKSITGLFYSGREPFTEKGMSTFLDHVHSQSVLIKKIKGLMSKLFK